MNQHDKAQRAILPIPDRPHVGLTTYDAKDPDTQLPADRARCGRPEGAPNVLVVLIDDVGFGASSAFGGPCETPNFERLANQGLRYNRFHTTALCAPTRAAMLTGRNHHSVGMGGVTEICDLRPGQQLAAAEHEGPARPDASAERLLDCAVRQVPRGARSGSRARWDRSTCGRPARGSSTSTASSAARTTNGTRRSTRAPTPVEPPKTPEEGYHLTEDLADHAVNWVRQQKALMPDKPFFMYFAPGATHAPHHVPKEWIEKYKGHFAHGWDEQRERTFARQKELGVIPADAELTRAACGDPGLGRHAERARSRSSSARWRSTPASSRTPTTTWAGCSTRSRSWGSWTIP